MLLFVGPYCQGLGMEAVQFVHEALDRFLMLLGDEFWLLLTQPFGDVMAFCEWRRECSRCQCGNLFNISMVMSLRPSLMGGFREAYSVIDKM